MIGKSILHYKIIEKLGEGGMGIVYLAEDTKLDRKVAIKFLPPHVGTHSEERKRFDIEARAAAALNHTNITHIYAIENVDEQVFIVMEYIDGITLMDKIHQAPIKLDELIKIAIQISEGLQQAHKQGIVHRDIKSSNILLTKNNETKIMDFGLAKLAEKTRLTKPDTIMGTTTYMSPEQTQGKKLDHRTDIFSLGVVLYEAITGLHPFKGEYDQAVIYSIINDDPEPITGLRSGIPMEFERIITKTMAKIPDERYQHVEEIIVDLRALEKNLDGNVTKRSVDKPEFSRINKRSRWTPVLWIISAMIMTIVVTVWLTKELIPLPDRSIIRFVHSLPADQKLELFKFYGSAVIISPIGNMLVYSATDSSGVTMLYRRSIDQVQSTAIPGTESAGSPFFSPDGKWVGFFADGKLKKISLMGGTAISICNAQSGYGASWGPDDTIIFSPTFTSGLLMVSVDGGTPKMLTNLDPDSGELSHRWPEILPDGEAVLYTIDSGMDGDNKQIAIYEISTGQQRTLISRGTNARYSDGGYIVYLMGGMLMAVPFDIGEMEVTGTAIRALDGVQSSAAGGGQFSFSKTGVLVWIPADELTYLSLDSSSPVSFRRVTKSSLTWTTRNGDEELIRAPSRGYWAPNLSPDGHLLAITIDLDIFILELERGTLTRFTFEGRNHLPVWTPDSKRIIFSSARNGHPNLFWKSADGSGTVEQLLSSKQHQDPGSWSPDGKMMTYAELHPETNWDIWLLNFENGRKSEQFLHTRFNEYHPMLSPDGRWLAYTSDESGQPEVYVRSFPTGSGKWHISTDGGQQPLWARDGSEIYYRNSGKIMAVKIETDASFLAQKPVLLFKNQSDTREMNPFGSPNYDVHPDGKFLLIKPDPISPLRQINITLNWFEEFRYSNIQEN